ncbi:hypothetical protein [Actinoplanes derwentensis]|uniref:Uncharacterized protein n=1 Tax=Actinoplanes derwentensis TaxID=113562 RepID=A0A1H2D7H8_9ACTN|nr:hypothetical protein [Actinoplanes derwentensis]GID89441.1 hypothetical protein Ade03nite_83650 [Actinoplanes derwentensis]SDT78507.1 hypothetical protein SAMN04489716_8402 [Actinoplanes derwentensis]
MSVALYALQARVDEQEELLVGALTELSDAMDSRRRLLVVEPLGSYSGLAGVDLPEIREQFYNR